jgi:predicted DNA-binding protein
MARKKISTTVYITEEQDQQLKELSRRTKVPVSVYIRDGIDLILRQHQEMLPGQLTLNVKE